MKRRIIVVGSNHHNTLGLTRCLGMAGFRVDLILTDHDGYVSKSRYVEHKHIARNSMEIIDILLKEYDNETDHPFVISCTDSAASVLDEYYNTLVGRFDFFTCGEPGKLTHFMNKQVQVTIAESSGLDVPLSCEYKGILPDINYPCLLKPVKSIKGGKKIVICNHRHELISGLAEFSTDDEVLVQQFIKKESEIVVLGCSVGKDVSIPGYILKHRDFDGGTLYSSAYPINDLPKSLVDGCKRMITLMNYEGLFGIEFIKSGHKYYFIEANLRNDATTYSLAVGGSNLPAYYINSKMGLDKALTPISKKIYSIVEYNDFKHRKDFGIGIFLWLRQYFNAECKYYWNLVDPLPFFWAPLK